MSARFRGDHARAANFDTFAYTNAAPQVNTFTQSKQLWVGLEDYVLEFADSTDQRIVVLTGPVFAHDDVEYRGIRVPQQFFKVAGWMAAGELAATAYLLDQSDLIARVVRRGATHALELGAFRTFRVTWTMLPGSPASTSRSSRPLIDSRRDSAACPRSPSS